MKILVVEDHVEVAESIAQILEEYEVDVSFDGSDGLFKAQQNIYDAIILDVMLPQWNGFDIVKQLRKEGIKTPVLFLTARDSLEDRVNGLNYGGDDYLVKPFQIEELKARVYALLRRSGSLTVEKTLKYKGIELFGKEKDIEVDGQKMKLTAKQYELLEYFIQNRNIILTKEQIYDRVWGFDSDTVIEIVEVFVHHLRKKLEPFGYHQAIKTVRGVGYILKDV